MSCLYKLIVFPFWFSAGTAIGAGSQTIRVAPPGSTIIRAASGAHTLTPGSKQIITVHKAGGVAQGGGTGQPQIVTLVKTSQGMTVATVCTFCNKTSFII